ncbi:unnamed protein product [Arabidopsis arenosa]|uniref:C2H2-type domain-containing protein n=1 Tax=Arabidopsis arenosa TaxID=38785 RepID=A0A8S2AT23_ARAAE|nr:unnamed protein product [Arabidopsis arenosa]
MTNNPEKTKVDDVEEEEREDSDEQCSDEETDTREIVLGLPALSISSRIFVDSSNVAFVEDDVEKARLNEQAVLAAGLVLAAAEEAVMKGVNEGSGSGGKKKSRPRTSTKTGDEADGSGKGEAKKPKKKASELTHPPKGPPECHICGRRFVSWKAVFGHMRAHKDRNYQGFLPPPTFSAADVVSIPGLNSAFAIVTAGGGSCGGIAVGGGSSGGISGAGGSTGGVSGSVGAGGASGRESGKGSGIDLNVDPIEEAKEAVESGFIAKFDLNKSPPKDEDEEDKTK